MTTGPSISSSPPIYYHLGQGVEQGNEQALHFFQSSAEQKEARARYLLADYYSQGLSTLPDRQRAVELWQQLAAQGAPNAQYMLALCYYQGTGIKQDQNEALVLLQLLAEQGYTEAQTTLKKIEKAEQLYVFAVYRDMPEHNIT